MSVNQVRMGRIPNSMKQIIPKMTSNKQNNFSISLDFLIKLNKLDSFKLINPQSIIPRSFLSQSNANENQIIILTMLRDKAYQLYKESITEFDRDEKRALELINFGYKPIKYNFTKDFMLLLKEKLLDMLKKHAMAILYLINELPGFKRLNVHDQNIIASDTFFYMLGIRSIKLFKNNDFFLMLDYENNIQCNKEVIRMVAGDSVCDLIFNVHSSLNQLDLTEQEHALLIPFFLSRPSNSKIFNF